MVEIQYLTTQEINQVHDDLLKVTCGLGGDSYCGSIDYITGLAECLGDMGFEDTSLAGLAAFYMTRIARGHCFNDGNKRTAYFSARFFLMKNGADFNGESITDAVQEVDNITCQSSMDEAYEYALGICRRDVIEHPPDSMDYDVFHRLVIKSIGVANMLADS
jgi:death-on-curing protein